LADENSAVAVEKRTVGIYQTNSYVVRCTRSGEAMVIDAPGPLSELMPQLQGQDIRLIVLTHAHMDHLEALDGLRERLGVPLAMHVADAGQVRLPPERLLEDGDVLRIGELQVRVLHTPGHTPGGICLLWGKHLFSGDTLFPGGPGKTWRPVQFQQVVDSITRKLFPLPDDVVVHPGHGQDTLLGKEKEEFAIFSQRPHPQDLCGDVLWLSS
jgi:glyoxylase-like metal-dependent hydrolase (beta-lactamase superfamily II)